MPITERTLKKWRREALVSLHNIDRIPEGQRLIVKEPNEKVLRMTSELLDQHLLRKEIR